MTVNQTKLARFLAAGVSAATALTLAACSPAPQNAVEDGSISGEITFVTNRPDLDADGTYASYIAEFQKAHPNVNVKVEAVGSTFDDDVRTRMSSPNGYGDVTVLPTLSSSDLPDFFEPLGATKDLAKKYRFLTDWSVDGQQYALTPGGTVNGVAYNTEVFANAGVTELPATPDEFIEALKKIKANTEAVPYYTNYKDGWPLGAWAGNIGVATGDVNAKNELAHDAEPWTEGGDLYTLDSLLFDIVHEGLNEKDPVTTNWNQSKIDLATGKIGAMVLGSWSIAQLQDEAKKAGVSSEVIGFMPFPATAPDGERYANAAGDRAIAVNKNSTNKATARAWLEFLVEKSGYSESQGMMSPLADGGFPDNLAAFEQAGVKIIELAGPPKGEDGLLDEIAEKAQVDLWGNVYRQKLVDIARGQAAGDKDSYFAELNGRWSGAREAVTK